MFITSKLQKGMDIHFKEAECYQIDSEKKKIHCRTTGSSNLGGKEEFEVDYDILVITVGARANTFNTPGVVEHAHFLKVRICILFFVLFIFPI